MTWHVQYRDGGEDHVRRFPTPELAIAAACGLIDDGREVTGIGTGELSDSVGMDEIRNIYDLWRRARPR